MDNTLAGTGIIFKIKRFSIHDGPGIRTSVFIKGCPLNCIWCHSPEGITSDISIWHYRNLCIACGQCVEACPSKALKLTGDHVPEVEIDRNLCRTSGECVRVCPSDAMQYTGSVMTLCEVIGEVEKDIAYYRNSGGGITLTGGEPFYQPGFASEILKECRIRGIHTAVETCLYYEEDILKELSEFVDYFIVDLKLFDPEQHKSYTGKSNEIIKENFRYIAGLGKSILVRLPLIKDITDTETNKDSILRFVKETDKNIPVEYISYNPLAVNNYDRLGIPFLLK